MFSSLVTGLVDEIEDFSEAVDGDWCLLLVVYVMERSGDFLAENMMSQMDSLCGFSLSLLSSSSSSCSDL